MPTVLLVDDSSVARLAVARRLEDEGLDVRTACSAAEARAVDVATCDCAIIDVDLEDTSGPDLATELRGMSPSLPVAFFTAGATDELVERSQVQGPVFTKPDLEPLVAWAQAASRGQPPPTK
jgi:DNA-binding NtrC family response regulator